jgi:hypothetical protein
MTLVAACGEGDNILTYEMRRCGVEQNPSVIRVLFQRDNPFLQALINIGTLIASLNLEKAVSHREHRDHREKQSV